MTANEIPAPRDGKFAVCTYFDSNYLARGMVMLKTLLAHNPAVAPHVLCLDDATKPVLDAEFGDRITTIPLAELHRFEPRLPGLRATRSPWEFYATHKPAMGHYVMTARGPFEWVTFVDADTAFYGSLSPVFDELSGASIGLSSHRYGGPEDTRSRTGKFNAGFVSFHNGEVARRCVRDWQEDCIAWCKDRMMRDGRWMNQGYLSRWPERYPGVHVIKHAGANLAPWNLATFRIVLGNRAMSIDGYPLIFFHFSGLSPKPDGSWDAKSYGPPLPRQVVIALYQPYLRTITRTSKSLLARHGISGIGSVRFDSTATAPRAN